MDGPVCVVLEGQEHQVIPGLRRAGVSGQELERHRVADEGELERGWIEDRRGVLWIGRRKITGRGEGASGLRFDIIRRGHS